MSPFSASVARLFQSLFARKQQRINVVDPASASPLPQPKMAGISFSWNEACSICFENRCEFSFPRCQDQFCTSCIERYFNELIVNSWGLPVCTIKCPVCYDVLPKHVWCKYVSSDMISRYERFNQPYRQFARFCNGCGTEANPVASPSLAVDALVKAHEQLALMLDDKVGASDDIKEQFERLFDGLTQGAVSATELFRAMLGLLTDSNCNLLDGGSGRTKQLDASSSRESLEIRMSGGQPEKRRRTWHPRDQVAVAEFMAVIVSLERAPEHWRRLQHAFIKSFPKASCSDCGGALCLQCGESHWHDGMSCEEHYSSMLAQASLDDDVRATVQWKLSNSKRCPSCAVLINREDGCNKVDCLHCGFEFCWVCLNSWSTSCGFFRCVSDPKTPPPEAEDDAAAAAAATTAPESSSKHHDQPEIGVPNVSVIQKKLSQLQQQREEQQRQAQEAAAAAKRAAALHMPLVKDWLLGSLIDHEATF